MSIKRILVPIPASVAHEGGTAAAVSAARTLNSHLEALFIREPPPAPAGAGVQIGSRAASMGASLLEISQSESERHEQRARKIRDQFAQACNANQVRFLENADGVLDPPTASWHEAEGSHGTIAVSRATAFDLVIASSGSVAAPLKEIAEGSLLQSRRPVLLAPVRPKDGLADVVMIAWDESPECWHAVTAALPFLTRARQVLIVSIDTRKDARKASQEKAQAYLRCHGVDARTKTVEPMSRAVGDAILATAGDENVDLVVMGAYSHGRLREMLVGGATRHVLNNASATPVFLAH